MLEGFEGELVADGYSAYGAAARALGGRFRVSTCWSHARRGLLEAEQSYPEAAEALNLIGEMFLIERDLPAKLVGVEPRDYLRAAAEAALNGGDPLLPHVYRRARVGSRGRT